ncbi:MAG: hypothetical protein KBC64_03980 [Simkaniaceae bacterium]|nr:hypothetical protein [Simkaniaceae bacterium]
MELTLSRAFRVDNTSHLFWLLLGPTLLALSLTIAPSILVGVIAAGGLLSAFRFTEKGILSVAFLLFLSFFIHHDRVLWDITWNISVLLSLVVTVWGAEESKAFIEEEKKGLNLVIEEIKVDYATCQHKNLEEIKRLEEEHRDVLGKLEESTDNLRALKQLVQATTIESDKLYKEVDDLYKLRREDDLLITALRQNIEEGEKRLKELNLARVENFQLKQLIQEPEVKQVEEISPLQERLQTLEAQKSALKKECELLEDKEAIKLKKKELVAIDKDLFNVKKEMRDQGLFFSNSR